MPDPLPQKDDLRVVVLVGEGRGGREGAPQNLQKRKKHKVSAGIVAWDGRATSAGASDASPKKGVGCGDHSPPPPRPSLSKKKSSKRLVGGKIFSSFPRASSVLVRLPRVSF